MHTCPIAYRSGDCDHWLVPPDLPIHWQEHSIPATAITQVCPLDHIQPGKQAMNSRHSHIVNPFYLAPKYSAVCAASSATGISAVPAVQTAIRPLLSFLFFFQLYDPGDGIILNLRQMLPEHLILLFRRSGAKYLPIFPHTDALRSATNVRLPFHCKKSLLEIQNEVSDAYPVRIPHFIKWRSAQILFRIFQGISPS